MECNIDFCVAAHSNVFRHKLLFGASGGRAPHGAVEAFCRAPLPWPRVVVERDEG